MEELLNRGVERLYPSREALAERLSRGPLRLYWGIDPTGPDLHLGHLAMLLKLRDFQTAGHQVILVIGDFTARIGDPTDKLAARRQLSAAEVKANFKTYRRQLGRFLNLRQTEVMYNSRWLGKLNAASLLVLAAQFTVSQLSERDMFRSRLDRGEPVYVHEFFYPLLQAYDSWHLAVDLELGGNDQTFNMLMGRDLQKNHGQEKFVMALKLLTDGSGKKMGKTDGNMARLNDGPAAIYGQIMSWPDERLAVALELLTRLTSAEREAVLIMPPRDAKMRLAREVVALTAGATRARVAEREWQRAFQQHGLPADVLKLNVRPGVQLGDVLVTAGVVKSKSEWRRLVTAGAVEEISGTKIADPNHSLISPLELKIGKKRFAQITLKA
ncbi:MAG: tyrosine--tRNA ligase [Patescibacteria group bacterium]|mgnify:CR=1 FL=1